MFENAGYFFLALGLALLLPLALIATRRELQKVRSQIIEDLRQTLFKDQQGLPQLELVAARYRNEGNKRARQNYMMIWTGAFIFALVSLAGFCLLFTPLEWLIGDRAAFPKISPMLFWVTPSKDPAAEGVICSTAIGAVAFLGGYLFQSRYLIRAALNEELSALAFVRASLAMLSGVLLAVVAYRVVDGSEAFPVKLGAAFVIGYWPDLGLARLAKWLKVQAKLVDENALGEAKIIPIEIIDGIDAETGLRLGESNIYDVQNLATVSPVELYAETPFGLFETFDWVLQAQLCVIVGAKTFHALKAHNIRTIFDLERAILAEGAPPEYVQALGAVLFLDASPLFRSRVGLPPVEGSDGAGITVTVDVVRHAVAIVGDDLHVHRLRALWTAMMNTTSAGTDHWLYKTGHLPGEANEPTD